jgi:hypothetical protein
LLELLREAEMRALDERVDRHHAQRSRPHDRGVVADAAQYPPTSRGRARARTSAAAVPAAAELGGDRLDEGALGDALAQRCR